MNEDEFLLKWNNHQTNFVDVFNHLLRDDSFVDVTLVCGGEAVLGHKMVLAACSPLLYRILRDNPCKHPVLILSDVPAGDMRAMMKFIYQGEVSVSQSELASFLKTADNLQIKGLAEDRERDKEHRSKDERKRKDKDDRTEGTRPSHKRQRLSDVRPAAAADNYSPLLSGSHKLVSDSHSSHKVRSKASSSSSSASSPDEHLIKCGGSGNTGSSTHLTSTSKHISSETLSSKVIHGISGKVCNSSKESASLSNANGDTLLLKTSERENMTIKMEPMDYPGEVMWTEGHSAISSDILDDPQPLIPLGAITTTLEGVPVTVAASPNLPVLDANDDGQCDEESREEVSADDINANTTMMGTWVPGIVTDYSNKDGGTASVTDFGHPTAAVPPLGPLSALLPLPSLQLQSSSVPLPPAVTLLKKDPQEHQAYPASLPTPVIGNLPSLSLPLQPVHPAVCPPSGIIQVPSLTQAASSNSSTSVTVTSNNNNNVHKCQQCPFITSNPYTFTRHLRIHLGTKEFQCRVCAFASSRKDSLIRHFRMKHLTGEMSVYNDLESRDIEEFALVRGLPENL